MVAARPEDLPFETRRPFTRADAVRAGAHPRVLRTSLFRRIFRGVYIAADVPDSPFVRAEAAVALHPDGAFASHTSAARVYRLPVPTDVLEHVTVTREQDRRERPEVRSHVTTGRPRVLRVRGIPVSHPFQLFVELAAMLSLVDLVVVGDAMVRRFDIAPQRLVKECRKTTGPHAARAPRAASYVRAGVDSPMETRLRLLIVLAGLPEPVVNHEIRDEYGNVLRRLDLSYPWLKLIVEYDGRHHVERRQQWNSDLVRREEFDDGGWKILVVTAEGVYGEPERTVERIRRNLAARGCRELPRRLSDAWRPFFPGRS